MTDTYKIRILLGRYYSGCSSPDDERLLGDFFATASGLPDDLEADRALFVAMRQAADEQSEIPDRLDARIADALEAEMARDRRAARTTFRRRLLWSLSGAAACLLAVFAAYTFVPGQTERVPAGAVAVNVTPVAPAAPLAPAATASADTIANTAPAPADGTPGKSRRPHKARKTRRADKADGMDRTREAEMLVAANYRVVEDEREADAIISSIFGRMESNLAQETNRVDEIGLEYECEVNKLCSY